MNPRKRIASIVFSIKGIGLISMLVFAILCDARVPRARMIIAGNVFKTDWKFSNLDLLIIGFLVYLIGYVLFTVITNRKILCSGNEQSCDDAASIVCEKCAPVVLISLVLTYVIIFVCNVSSALTLFSPLQRHR